jgi:ribonuclease BN (tRNA processing enzyme)
MRLQFVGCGDAFGSGGRLNTCFHVAAERTNFLIDCGASSLLGMKRLGIDRNAIDAILITHFHADHFGGLPFFILDAHFLARRERPLTIAGPKGLAAWYARAVEVAYPGTSGLTLRFPVTLQELEIEKEAEIGTLQVTPYHVVHDDRAGPCLAHRVTVDGRTLAYSGDTEWTESLVPAASGTDLFICECYLLTGPAPVHLSLDVIEQHLHEIKTKRMILTHMGEDMLAHRSSIGHESAEDGKIVTL